MELRPQFTEFLQNIRPSERNKEEWKRGSNTLRARLMADPDLSPLITTSFCRAVSDAQRPSGQRAASVRTSTW